MRTQPSKGGKRLGFIAAALAAGVLLTACGDSHDHSEPPAPAPAPTPTPTPVPVIDSFFAYVSARVASLLDTDEPIDIDAVPVTTPENTEPEAVQ